MKVSKYALMAGILGAMAFATATTAAPNNPNHTTQAELEAALAAQDYNITNNITNNTTNTDSNLNRITNIEQRADELQYKMLGIKASMHAVTNARPIPYKVGDTALGFGLGTAGGQQAIAIGAGYRVNEVFSTSATISAETADSMTSDNVSAGAGLQFSF